MVMKMPKKCPNCPHIARMHRDGGEGKCRYGGCQCDGAHGTVKGGYVADLSKSAPVERRQPKAVQPLNLTARPEVQHKVGDIGSELSREFKRLTTKRGKS